MMKKNIMLLVMLMSLIMPIRALAAEYNTMNFKEALADEGITEEFSNYKETDDQITIYMFRGKGCGFCRNFLAFMNEITAEYGKYFKMVTYETWNDSKNSKLLKEVSAFLDEPAGGVPYIIIGDKVFPGFTEAAYGEAIKSAIVDLYNTKKDQRYDVFKAMEKEDKQTTSSSNGLVIVLLNLVFVAIGTGAVLLFNNYKFKKLEEQIAFLSTKQKSKKE